MFNTLMLCALLGVSATSKRGGDMLEIYFNATIVPAAQSITEITQLGDLDGVYRVVSTYIESGGESVNLTKAYLVIDRLDVLKTQPLMIARKDETIDIKTPNFLVVAMEWPDISDKALIAAFQKSYRTGIALASHK